ncbi:hypothetical protein Dimus_030757 [Dionaea muscipula]
MHELHVLRSKLYHVLIAQQYYNVIAKFGSLAGTGTGTGTGTGVQDGLALETYSSGQEQDAWPGVARSAGMYRLHRE